MDETPLIILEGRPCLEFADHKGVSWLYLCEAEEIDGGDRWHLSCLGRIDDPQYTLLVRGDSLAVSTCTCPAWQYRARRYDLACKHLRAILRLSRANRAFVLTWTAGQKRVAAKAS